MKSKAEDPTGDLPRLFSLVFELCKLDEDGMLSTGWFVVLPPGPRPENNLRLDQFAGWMEYVVDYAKAVMRREAFKVGLDRESLCTAGGYL